MTTDSELIQWATQAGIEEELRFDLDGNLIEPEALERRLEHLEAMDQLRLATTRDRAEWLKNRAHLTHYDGLD